MMVKRNVEANLYSLQTMEGGWLITKFDMLGLEIESQYEMHREDNGEVTCMCPAGHRPTCRHRQMLGAMIERADTKWLFRYGDATWHDVSGYKDRVDALNAEVGMTSAELQEVDPVNPDFADALAKLPEGVVQLDIEDPKAMHEQLSEILGESKPFKRRF